jgi:hypothetical protein
LALVGIIALRKRLGDAKLRAYQRDVGARDDAVAAGVDVSNEDPGVVDGLEENEDEEEEIHDGKAKDESPEDRVWSPEH